MYLFTQHIHSPYNYLNASFIKSEKKNNKIGLNLMSPPPAASKNFAKH